LFSIRSLVKENVNGRTPSADWRFPAPKQQRIEDAAKKIAEAQRRRAVADDEDAWWAAVLRDANDR
jgi:hypothetical protein